MPLNYYPERIDENEIIRELTKMRQHFIQCRNTLREQQTLPARDARILAFNKVIDTITAYSHQLALHVSVVEDAQNWQTLYGADRPLQQAQLFSRMLINYMISSFFLIFFLDMESTLRTIGRTYLEKLDGDITFGKIYTTLVDDLGLNEDYKNLCIILALLRNTMHNGTVYYSQRGDQRFTYKGILYEFINKTHCPWASIEIILSLSKDIGDFYLDIFQHPTIAAMPYIEDWMTQAIGSAKPKK
jgi:hypothetical protein